MIVPQALIEISNYSFGFGKTPVLKDVSLTVEAGEMLWIVANPYRREQTHSNVMNGWCCSSFSC